MGDDVLNVREVNFLYAFRVCEQHVVRTARLDLVSAA